MKKTFLSIVAVATIGTGLYAVETKTWLHSSLADFEEGAPKSLSIRSDGRIVLAPKTEELLDAATAVLWAVAEDSKGNVYAAGGGPGARSAKLFRVDAAGQATTLAELEGLEVQAIAINASDELFAATAPDGEVYRISPDGEAEVFFDPKEKYIWSLLIDRDGNLLVATGDKGRIYRVDPQGNGSIFFETEETHARSLAVDPAGNLIVGTEPNGLIIRVSPAGEGFVLHQSDKPEVTSVVAGPDGTVYAAAVGTKKSGPAFPTPLVTPLPQAAAPPAGSAPPDPQHGAATAPTTSTPAARAMVGIRTALTGGSELYRIDPEGYARTVWSHPDEIVYSIVLDYKGRPVFGTGNKGHVYRLDTPHLTTLLLALTSTQVTSLHTGARGGVYAATSNIGKLYRIGPNTESEGSLESEVLDAANFSYWGRVGFRGDTAGGEIALEVRSGNLDRPEQNWSNWSPVLLTGNDGVAEAPPARFLQYRLTLKAGPQGASPLVNSIEVAYLNKNVAPVLSQIAATPPNYRFPPQSLSMTKSTNLTLPPLGAPKRTPSKPVQSSPSQTMLYERGQVGVRWLASDDNGDELLFKVMIRGENESEWKLLEDELESAYFSWDSTAYADGEYRVRVTASDSPSNPPRQAMTAEIVSDPFLIDNTPPAIEGLAGAADGGTISARWMARDARTTIRKAEYSLDGSDWTVVEPVTRLSDSKQLDYTLDLEDAASGEHTLAVRVTDQFDNEAVAKLVVR